MRAQRAVRAAMIGVVALTVAVACSGSETATPPGVEPTPAPIEAAVSTPTPAAGDLETTGLVDGGVRPIPTPTPKSTVIPVEERTTLFPLALARQGDIGFYSDVGPRQGLCDGSNDGFRLIGYDIGVGDRGGQAIFDTGVGFDGRIVGMDEGVDGEWALLTSCGDIVVIEVNSPRDIAVVGQHSTAGLAAEATESVIEVWSSEWAADGSIVLRYSSWTDARPDLMVTTLDPDSGEFSEPTVESLETPVFDGPEDGLRFSTQPTRFIGGEGGDSWTITVERDGEFVPAIYDPQFRDSVGFAGMWFGPDRSMAWVSTLDATGRASVARYGADGHVVDAHGVAIDAIGFPGTLTPRIATFLPDGRLLALGYVLEPSGWSRIPAHGYHDLATDVSFVVSLDPQPQVDRSLAIRSPVRGLDAWYEGPTTSSNPECGGRTLYGDGPDGLYRVFPPTIELPPIAQALHGAPSELLDQGTWDDEGTSTWAQSSVLLLKCPGDELGRVVSVVDSGYGHHLLTADAQVTEILGIDDTEPWRPSVTARLASGQLIVLPLETELLANDALTPAETDAERSALAALIVEVLESKGAVLSPGGPTEDFIVEDPAFPIPVGLTVGSHHGGIAAARIERDPLLLGFTEGAYDGDSIVSGVTLPCGENVVVLRESYASPGGGPTNAQYDYYLRGLAIAVSWACGEPPDPFRGPAPAQAALAAATSRVLGDAGWDMATAGYDHGSPWDTSFVLGEPGDSLQVSIYSKFQAELDPDTINTTEIYEDGERKVVFSVDDDGQAQQAVLRCDTNRSIALTTRSLVQIRPPNFDLKDLAWQIFFATCAV